MVVKEGWKARRKGILLGRRVVDMMSVDGRWPCLLCLDLVSRSVVLADSMPHRLLWPGATDSSRGA